MSLFNLFNKKIILPAKLIRFGKIFTEAGFEAYLVGGAVRDVFLHKKASDWDVATNANPQQVMKLFKFVVPTGIEHGTVTVHFEKEEIEVTTFRTESDYSDGRHPDKIEYANTIYEDLSRRDFTMNAIAVNLSNGKIVDPFKGRKAIKKKLIVTVGNPHERFMEDGLRPVRAIRFASKLNFLIEKYTYSEIFKDEVKEKVKSISVERFRDEFIKIMQSEKPSVGLKLLEESGLLDIFIPEFKICRGCIQSDSRGFHKFDVLDHLFYTCDGAPKDKLMVRLAALFHDIGKPLVKKIIIKDGVETFTFYNHEIEGEKVCRTIMTRLKFSNDQINSVCHLVKEHMFHYQSEWTDAAVRRFIVRIGKENIDDLYDIRLADMYGMWNEAVDIRYSESIKLLIELKDRIKNQLEKQNALTLKDLAVNGRDLMEAGFPSGKELGIILNHLMDCVLEDPQLNSKEALLTIAKKTYR
jgi:putative nucleotidyltransferase with HDIG domain